LKVAIKFWRLGTKFDMERRSKEKKKEKEKIIDAKPKIYCPHILSHNKEVTKAIKTSGWKTVFGYQPLNEI